MARLPTPAEISRVSQEIGVPVDIGAGLAAGRLEGEIVTAAIDEAQRNARCREKG